MTDSNKGEKLIFEIPAELDGVRLDKALSQTAEQLSRSFIQKLIGEGNVRINGEECTEKKQQVFAEDAVEVEIPEPAAIDVVPQDIPLDIIHEDEDVIVVNKPAGMVVHPGAGNPDGTLVNALLFRYRDELSSINGILRPGIVHRIDKDTSGLLMVARNDRAHEALSAQLAEHSIRRAYTAIVMDNIREDEGTVDKPIGRDPHNRLRNAIVSSGGKRAITHYRVLERFGRFTLIEAVLETGRTHQIRVHMASIKHPLLGDALYGPEKNGVGAKRQMLHARTLGFTHPGSGQYMLFESPLPDDIREVLERLRKDKK